MKIIERLGWLSLRPVSSGSFWIVTAALIVNCIGDVLANERCRAQTAAIVNALAPAHRLDPVDTLRQGFAEQCEAEPEPALTKESPDADE